jgi:hypothetical protein
VGDASAVKGRAIREDNIYGGVRLNLKATLGKAVIPLQIDIGFGDAPAPAPKLIEHPTTLDSPAAQLRAYRRETVIAEKFNAMVELGLRNTCLKDFYDLWALANSRDFEGEVLSEAIRVTFARKRTSLPTATPVALTIEFAGEQLKQNEECDGPTGTEDADSEIALRERIADAGYRLINAPRSNSLKI